MFNSLADAISSSMNCETKTQLLFAYQQAANVYSKAVAALARSIGAVLPHQYEKLNVAAETARLAAIEARNTLEAHIYEHRCDNSHETHLLRERDSGITSDLVSMPDEISPEFRLKIPHPKFV
jgi:hypothetical protein